MHVDLVTTENKDDLLANSLINEAQIMTHVLIVLGLRWILQVVLRSFLDNDYRSFEAS